MQYFPSITHLSLGSRCLFASAQYHTLLEEAFNYLAPSLESISFDPWYTYGRKDGEPRAVQSFLDLLPMLNKLKHIDMCTYNAYEEEWSPHIDFKYDQYELNALQSLSALQVLDVDIHVEHIFPLLQHLKDLNQLHHVSYSRITEAQWTSFLTFPIVKNCTHFTIDDYNIKHLTIDQLTQNFMNVQQLTFRSIHDDKWKTSAFFSSLESIFNTEETHVLPPLLPKLQQVFMQDLEISHSLCCSLMSWLSMYQLEEVHLCVDHIMATQQAFTVRKLTMSHCDEDILYYLKHIILDKLVQYYNTIESISDCSMLDRWCICCKDRTLLGGLIERLHHFPTLREIQIPRDYLKSERLLALKRCMQEMNKKKLRQQVDIMYSPKYTLIPATIQNVDATLVDMQGMWSDSD